VGTTEAPETIARSTALSVDFVFWCGPRGCPDWEFSSLPENLKRGDIAAERGTNGVRGETISPARALSVASFENLTPLRVRLTTVGDCG